jgi:hypothetical protein
VLRVVSLTEVSRKNNLLFPSTTIDSDLRTRSFEVSTNHRRHAGSVGERKTKRSAG